MTDIYQAGGVTASTFFWFDVRSGDISGAALLLLVIVVLVFLDAFTPPRRLK